MSNLAIIPARGGSKRIPRKNIKNFLGKPIIAYSIEVALKSDLFDEVMVSTDDEEIAEVAKNYGAVVPFMRSKKNSDDYATTADVITEVFNFYQNKDVNFSKSCCIYPTAPLCKGRTLSNAYELLVEQKYTTVFPVVRFSYPIWRALKVDASGQASMLWPKYKSRRSQDLEVSWHDAGQFYWLDVSSFQMKPELFGENSGALEIPEMEVQDIDSLSDWKMAELKAKYLSE